MYEKEKEIVKRWRGRERERGKETGENRRRWGMRKDERERSEGERMKSMKRGVRECVLKLSIQNEEGERERERKRKRVSE